MKHLLQPYKKIDLCFVMYLVAFIRLFTVGHPFLYLQMVTIDCKNIEKLTFAFLHKLYVDFSPPFFCKYLPF